MIKIAYVTSSEFKREENKAFINVCKLKDGSFVRDHFEFQIYNENITERLKVNLEDMVHAEVIEAYSKLKIPCIVEHAAIAYCNGMEIKIFRGETKGKLSAIPRGDREFYWDTVFMPDGAGDQTYAEIVKLSGLEEKILKYSQSAKAMLEFLEYLKEEPKNELWKQRGM